MELGQASAADRYIGRGVWRLLKGDRLTIESHREAIATCPVETDHLDAVPRDAWAVEPWNS
jgi:hypothetical protein